MPEPRSESTEAHGWRNRWDPRLLAGGLFLLLALPTVLSWISAVAQDRRLLKAQTEITATEVGERLSDHLNLRYAMMQSLSLEMASGEPWDAARFRARAEQIRRAFPGFQAINWVDGDGTIRWVNPVARNAGALGKRVSNHPKAGPAFAMARRTWSPAITPPLELFQGGAGFASYFPVGSRQASRGFVNAVFRIEPLVTQVLSPRVRDFFQVALLAGDRPVYVHEAKTAQDPQFSFERPLRFDSQRWALRLTPSLELTELTLSSGRRTWMGVLGLIAALAASFLAFRFFSELAARSRLASLVEASSDLIGLFDSDGRLQYINRAGHRLLGAPGGPERAPAPSEGLLNVHWRSLFEPRPDADPPGATPSLRDVSGKDWMMRPQDGSAKIDMEIVTFPVRGRRSEMFTGVIARDTRDRDRLERQLVQSQKLEAVGTLAGGIAHDFNNLLTAIAGNAELAKLDAIPGTELDNALGSLLEATELAAGLTTRLLAFSRRDNPGLEPFGLDDAVQASARLLRRLVREDLALEVVTAAPNATLRGDPAELQQVLMNLVVNARDAIEGRGRIQICTSMHHDQSGATRALLEVIDDGSGMTKDVLRSVFEPFFTTKPSGKGTGLGLAMVKSAVDRLGGTITVDSALGEGTKIVISLPAEDVSLAKASHVPQALVQSARRQAARILLAEDSPAIRKVLQTGLNRAGYEVISKESGEAALKELSEGRHRFDALLTDVVMPGADGVSLARAFRERYPAAPVIFISGYENEGAALDVLLHRSHLLPKPFRLTDLLDVLDTELRGSIGSLRAPH